MTTQEEAAMTAQAPAPAPAPIDTHAALTLAYRMANTLTADPKKVDKLLTAPWAGTTDPVKGANIAAIQDQVSDHILTAIIRHRRHHHHHSPTMMAEYLDAAANVLGVKLTKAEKSRKLAGFNLDDYILIARTVYLLTDKFRPYRDMQASQFNTHEMLHAFAQWLAVKDTIENGSGFPLFDAAMNELLTKRPPRFFTQGYNADFFVFDRDIVARNKDRAPADRIAYVICKKSYLSTVTITEAQKRTSVFNEAHFVLRVA